jgi:hypothetical protein
MSLEQVLEYDPAFDEAESEVERGEPWMFREDGAVNPLTIKASSPQCWSTGHTKYGEATFLSGYDRTGKRWSILIGAISLKKPLLEGLVEKWDDDAQGYVVVETLGPVQPGEIVSLKYTGEGENSAGQAYPRFAVSRKPAKAGEAATSSQGGDIPW